MLEQPHSLLEAGKVRFNGAEVGEFSFKRIAPEYPDAIWMPQPILAALLRKAQPFPTFTCWMGAKVSRLTEQDGRVIGVTGLRHGKEPFEIQADVVIGADGRYSAVARLGGFETHNQHHDFDIVWFTIPQPPGWSSTLYVSLWQRSPWAHAAQVSPRHPGGHRLADGGVGAAGENGASHSSRIASASSTRSFASSLTGWKTSRLSFHSRGLSGWFVTGLAMAYC